LHGKRLALLLRLAVLGLIAVLELSACSIFAPARPKKVILYPVKSGDTIYAIGRRFSVSSDEIISLNDIDDPRELRVGQIIRVPYRGQNLARGPLDTSFAKGKDKKPVTPDLSSLRKVKLTRSAQYVGKLRWPVGGEGGYISSRFGWRWLSFHEGIDISAPEGTPIYAAHSGQIVYAGDGIRGYGNLIVLKAEGLLTVYAHNRLNRVRVGESVRQGERIGDVGQTGKSTGPHLHFETRIRDQSGKNAAVDPLVFLRK